MSASKSPKNILQEYFQARKLDVPLYDTIPLASSPPQYQSIVRLAKDYGSFSGEVKSQKKMAEVSAAEVAIDKLGIGISIGQQDSEETELENAAEKYSTTQLFDFNWDTPNPIIIFDDLENVHKLATLEDFIQKYNRNNLKLIKIAAHTSNLKNKANYVVGSSNKDAADHFLTYLIGKLDGLITQNFKLIVLTSDHYGGALEDIMKDNPKITLRHVTCQDDCIQMINSFLE